MKVRAVKVRAVKVCAVKVCAVFPLVHQQCLSSATTDYDLCRRIMYRHHGYKCKISCAHVSGCDFRGWYFCSYIFPRHGLPYRFIKLLILKRSQR